MPAKTTSSRCVPNLFRARWANLRVGNRRLAPDLLLSLSSDWLSDLPYRDGKFRSLRRDEGPYQCSDPSDYSRAEQDIHDQDREAMRMVPLIGDDRRNKVKGQCDGENDNTRRNKDSYGYRVLMVNHSRSPCSPWLAPGGWSRASKATRPTYFPAGCCIQWPPRQSGVPLLTHEQCVAGSDQAAERQFDPASIPKRCQSAQ